MLRGLKALKYQNPHFQRMGDCMQGSGSSSHIVDNGFVDQRHETMRWPSATYDGESCGCMQTNFVVKLVAKRK